MAGVLDTMGIIDFNYLEKPCPYPKESERKYFKILLNLIQ